jgi:hypothetical protein
LIGVPIEEHVLFLFPPGLRCRAGVYNGEA